VRLVRSAILGGNKVKDFLLDLVELRPIWWWRYVLVLAIFAVIGAGLVLSWRPFGGASVFEGMVGFIVWGWPVLVGMTIVGTVAYVLRLMEQLRKEDEALCSDEFVEFDENEDFTL
jgi:amino acid transporter